MPIESKQYQPASTFHRHQVFWPSLGRPPPLNSLSYGHVMNPSPLSSNRSLVSSDCGAGSPSFTRSVVCQSPVIRKNEHHLVSNQRRISVCTLPIRSPAKIDYGKINSPMASPLCPRIPRPITRVCDVRGKLVPMDDSRFTSPTVRPLKLQDAGQMQQALNAFLMADIAPCLTDRSDLSSIIDTPRTPTDVPPPPEIRDRRGAVSSAPVLIENLKDWKPRVYPKSEQEERDIRNVISSNLSVLFGNLSEENKIKVVAAMVKLHVPKNTVLIKQGDEGESFYIVKEGTFNIFVKRLNGLEDKVLEASPGMFFGEVALMYNAPRSATCVAAEDSVVWSLDRLSFRMLLITEENTRKNRYETLLEHIEIFKCLTQYERCRLSDLLAVRECKKGECVIKQGDRGDKFYIVEKGEFLCTLIKKDGPEVLIRRYYSGGYFGELALISEYGLRNASLYSAGDGSVLLWIDKSTFDRVLGPLVDIFRNKAQLYPRVTQFS